jgi:uncharacterized protein
MSSRADVVAPPVRDGLLVSIHDVTPALEAPVRALWTLCQAHGITPALLVVPDWHGAWPIERAPTFMAWVRECADAGAEIVLHGERHDEVGSPRGWRDEWRAVGRTAQEGEFLTLSYHEAAARIARGLTRLSTHALTPVGFIPPAWLAREETHRAVRDAGLHASEDAAGVRVHPAGVKLDAPALRWSGRTTARAWGSRAMAAVRWRTQRDAPLVRLALHPQDLAHPITAASVLQETARWIAARPVVRYAQL